MAEHKALFTVGVFGLACCNDNGTLRIKVNVRTDQDAQKKAAGLAKYSPVQIVDMPGGGVTFEDFVNTPQATLFDVLRREIDEETRGCTVESHGDFSWPFMFVGNVNDPEKAVGDLAFWAPIVLKGKPEPSPEALAHPWVSKEQLEAEIEYRPVGKLGKNGRTGRMLLAAFNFYECRRIDKELFSIPE